MLEVVSGQDFLKRVSVLDEEEVLDEQLVVKALHVGVLCVVQLQDDLRCLFLEQFKSHVVNDVDQSLRGICLHHHIGIDVVVTLTLECVCSFFPSGLQFNLNGAI